MKKRIHVLGLAMVTSIVLGGCGGNDSSSIENLIPSSEEEIVVPDGLEDDPIQLERDPAKDYTYAESSNKDGSAAYEIFVRSFYDSNDDGVGDLNGVKAKLPYLADMGFKTLWLMPIFPSGSYHGYDVINYFDVNSDYGTLNDFDSLIAEANKYNIDIMLDMVLNHCSIKNPYFTESFADYKNNNTASDSKKDWFNYGPGGDHVYEGVQYESKFDASMPDFNLDSEGVRAEIEKICKFWIERGVKGFRLDAVLYYYSNNTDKNISFLNWLASTCHKYDENFYMVGEAWASSAAIDTYFSSSCDSFFDFSVATGGDTTCINNIKGMGAEIDNLASAIEAREKSRKKKNSKSYTSYFLSNHDQDRIAKNFTKTDSYKSACTFYTLLPGETYTYYGEEIALKGTRVTSPDDQSDARRRLPIIWSETDKTGECSFPETNRKDLADNEQVSKGVEDLRNEKFSLINHYKMMIHLRNKYSWIKHATFKNLTGSLNSDERYVMAYSLEYNDQKIIVVHNFENHNVEVDAPGSKIVEQINITHRLPELTNGKLRIAAHNSVIIA